MFKLIAGVIAVVTAAGGFMSWKYSTTSTCEAAEKAIVAEMPKILDDLADRDARFKALKVGGALFGGVETFVAGAASQLATEEVEDSSALDCVMLVAQRELDPSGFREEIGDRMADKLASNLSF